MACRRRAYDLNKFFALMVCNVSDTSKQAMDTYENDEPFSVRWICYLFLASV